LPCSKRRNTTSATTWTPISSPKEDLEVLGSYEIGDGESYGDGEMGSAVYKIRLEKQEVK